MTWSIRILPLEREAFLEALANYDVVHGSAADLQQMDDAKSIVTMMLEDDVLDALAGERLTDSNEHLYECSLTGNILPEAASLSINVYRKPAEAQPQPAVAEEAEALPEEAATEE